MDKASVQPVEKTELEEAQKTPAFYSNKFYITISPGGVRITFAESHPDLPLPAARTAVLLPFQDAFALRDVLGELLEKNVKIEMQTQQSSPAKPASDG